jgi:hypothetical protein
VFDFSEIDYHDLHRQIETGSPRAQDSPGYPWQVTLGRLRPSIEIWYVSMVSFWPRAALGTLSQTAKCHTFPFAEVQE